MCTNGCAKQTRCLAGPASWSSSLRRVAGRFPYRAIPVASSSSTADIESDLVSLGLSNYVSAVIGGDAVENPKPAPDAYLRALEAVDGDAASAVAIEDTPLGISAAKAAGLYCVAYTNDYTEHLDLSAADEIVDDLTAEVIETLL